MFDCTQIAPVVAYFFVFYRRFAIATTFFSSLFFLAKGFTIVDRGSGEGRGSRGFRGSRGSERESATGVSAAIGSGSGSTGFETLVSGAA